MKYFLFISLNHFFCCYTYSQKEANVWYFGGNAGIDFNTGSPVALTNGAMTQEEGCASISDKNTGQLLFYTDGKQIWNKNHVVMPNGSGLMGGWSSTQSAIIVPKPGSASIYYVFTAAQWNGFYGIRYSEVDMTLSGGLGDVSTKKNIALVTPAAEKLCAVKQKNNQDFWVITHGFNNNIFYAYALTAAGVNAIPVSSNVGTVHSGNNSEVGQLKVSPDGSKLSLATWSMNVIELFDFDNQTGQVSNAVTLPAVKYEYGVEFSPDNSRLYFATWGWGGTSSIHQFDLKAGSVAAIIASKTLIYSTTDEFASLQLAPDGKIYVARYTLPELGVINDPNKLGVACNYVNMGFSLAGKKSEGGLPAFVSSYFNFNVTSFSFENKGFKDASFAVYPNPSSDVFTLAFASTGERHIAVYNTLGVMLLKTDAVDGRVIAFDLSDRPSGMYFVAVLEENGTSGFIKLVKE